MSSSDDGASRLSDKLDEVLGTSAASSWSVDDEPENGSDAGPAPDAVEAADPSESGPDDTGELDWSVDDLPPDDDDQAPPPQQVVAQAPENAEPAVLDAHDIVVPDHDEETLPASTAGFVLPDIVQATADIADEPEPQPEPALPPGQHAVAPAIVEPVAPAPRVIAPTPVAPAPVAPAPAAPATGWHEHVPTAKAGSTRTPSRRPRVRRVTRVLRHIDPWSTFKLALLFSLVAYVSVLTSGVLLWRVADTTGALDNVERWFTQFGWETFEFKGGEIFHNAWIIGLFGVVFATGGAVLLVTLFNLVSDIIGGIRLTVLEEEVVERTVSSTRRYVVRRPGTVDAVADSTAAGGWSLDDDAATSPVPDAPSEASAAAEPPPSQAVTDDWSVDDDPSPAPTG